MTKFDKCKQSRKAKNPALTVYSDNLFTIRLNVLCHEAKCIYKDAKCLITFDPIIALAQTFAVLPSDLSNMECDLCSLLQ